MEGETMINKIGMRPLSQLYLSHYTAIIAVLELSLFGMIILISNNRHYSHQKKILCNFNLILLLIYNVADWASVILTFVDNSDLLHLSAKAISYILPPVFCCFVIRMLRQFKCPKILLSVVVANTIFETASIFNGWCFRLGPYNLLHQGPYHFFYTFCWVVCLIYVAKALTLYSKSISLGSKFFIAYMFVFVAAGVLTQDLSDGYIRTAGLTINIAFTILILDYQIIDLETSDQTIDQKERIILTDPLTGLKSRYAYEALLKDDASPLRERQLTAFSIDINGLKHVNDTYGHAAGDILIKSAAQIIQKTFVGNPCYRTGGDEFAVVVYGSEDRGQELLEKLSKEEQRANQNLQLKVSLAAGMAFSQENPNGNMKELMIIADQRMYNDKRKYYMDPKHDRRRR